MRRYDAIVFDWGNTIVDYPLRTAPEQIAFLRKFLLDRKDRLADLVRDGVHAGLPDQDWLEHFNNEGAGSIVRPFGDRLRTLLRDTVPPAIIEDLELQLCSDIFAASRVVDGAPEILAAARRAGYRVCILSNTPWGTSPSHWRSHVADHAFARESCDAVIFCGDVGYRKPHQAIFQHCMRTLRTVPEKTVMVGDSLTSDVLGAQRCGLSGVWLNRHRDQNPDRHVAVERLEQLADLLGF
jgi:HAD superfamily hydrolase (TIGR01662 family)